MEPEIEDNPAANRFEIRVGEQSAGRIDYRRKDGAITLVHTEIDPEFGGRGLGSKLVVAALDQAREQGLEVLPMCPFVRAYIKDHPEYLDLVPESERERFGL